MAFSQRRRGNRNSAVVTEIEDHNKVKKDAPLFLVAGAYFLPADADEEM